LNGECLNPAYQDFPDRVHFIRFKKETGLGEEERGGKMITQSCLLRKNNFSKNKLQFANHGAKRPY
jgi:hypothetical protein